MKNSFIAILAILLSVNTTLKAQTKSYTHETAPTQYIDVKGNKFAYRSFGKQAGVPLVFLQHFTGTMDNWDPAVTNSLAKNHHVILFNNKGVSTSSGKTPNLFLKWQRTLPILSGRWVTVRLIYSASPWVVL